MQIDEAKRRAKSGPLMLLSRRAFALVITLLSTVTVARLVAPREYGLANMALVIFVLAQAFREFGLTNAIMRKGEINQQEVSFLFWFNAGATTLLSLLLLVLAGPIAAFYKEPQVRYIVYVAAIGFFMSGLALQHRAVISRALRFGPLALIDCAAQAAGFATTLTLALIRHDVWSIVIGQLVQSVTGSVLSVLFSGWRPGRFAIIPEIRDLLKFGGNSFVFTVCMFFADNSAAILIGHFIGPSPLGQYNRAQTLYNLPNTNVVQPIVQASMPLMARLRPHPDEYRQAYLDLVRNLCTFLFPLSIALTFSGRALIETVLGGRWGQAGDCFTMLAPSLAFFALGYSAGDLFITQNRAGEMRTLGLIEAAVRVGAIALAVRYGAVVTALAFTLSNSVMALRKVYVASRTGPVTLRDHVSAASSALPLAAGAAFGALLVSAAAVYRPMPAHVLAPLQIGSAALGALVFGLCLRTSRQALLSIVSLFGLHRLFRLRRAAA